MADGVELTPEEEYIFNKARATGDLNIFTEYFFQLPFSGTWYTTEDNVAEYNMLHDAWVKLGKPDERFDATLDGIRVEIRVMWDEYYGGEPMFLLPHGYRLLPWITEFVSAKVEKALAITGTGTGKTSNIAIAALTYCALYPGFDFLNASASQAQSDLMLGEIEKWVTGSKFEKFIVKNRRGSNILWKMRHNYPTVTINVYGVASTVVCQTLSRSGSGGIGSNILGGERDWINVDEAQLVQDIDNVRAILATRLRGVRRTGVPRLSKETWITNPGLNPALDEYRDILEKLAEEYPGRFIVIDGLDQSANIYLTKRQKDAQVRVMTEGEADRWIRGLSSALSVNQDIGEQKVQNCYSEELDKRVRAIGEYSERVGLMSYELPYVPGRNYIAVGDVGKSTLTGLHSMNVPCVMVFDITDFLKRPMELVAFYWRDGRGTYETWVDLFSSAMVRYRCVGYYDSTNVQTALEDFSRLGDMPTYPVYFSGGAGKKQWALAVLNQLFDDGQFKFPKIKGLWYQARIYDIRSKKIPDDIIATLMVLALAFQIDGTLWDLFVDRYKWEERDEEERVKATGTYIVNPYARIPLDDF